MIGEPKLMRRVAYAWKVLSVYQCQASLSRFFRTRGLQIPHYSSKPDHLRYLETWEQVKQLLVWKVYFQLPKSYTTNSKSLPNSIVVFQSVIWFQWLFQPLEFGLKFHWKNVRTFVVKTVATRVWEFFGQRFRDSHYAKLREYVDVLVSTSVISLSGLETRMLLK